MNNASAEVWDQDFLDILVLAEKNTHRLFYLTVKRGLDESKVDTQRQPKNLVKLEEKAAQLRWSLKRNYYLNLTEYGLSVNVRIKGEMGDQYQQPMSFTTCFNMIDKRGFEDGSLEFWPAQFSDSQEFKEYLSTNANLDSLIFEQQAEIAA